MILFSILHSSARPAQWRQVYDAWMSAALHPEQVEYVLCVDERWGFSGPPEFPGAGEDIGARPQNLFVVWNTQRRCYVDGVNQAAAAAHGRILIVNADDQYPALNWDESIISVLERRAAIDSGVDPARWPDGVFATDGGTLWPAEFVIEVSTGTPREHERNILVMPIVSRSRYERLGYLFYPQYESMYADNDLCSQARLDGVVIDARALVFPHRHPLFDSSVPTDEQYEAQNSPEAYRHGAAIFRWRERMRFGQVQLEAQTIEGWMRPYELDWLSLQASQVTSVVEIGCWKGRTTYALAAACSDGQVYAVDTFAGTPGDPQHAFLVRRAGGSTYQEFKTQLERYQNVIVERDDSFEAAKRVPDCDMVFVDGGHSYDRVLADLKAWAPKAKKLLCGHDYSHADVKRAVTEVLGPVDVEPDTDIWFKVLPQARWTSARRTIALCLTGELFNGAYLDAMLNLYGHLVNRDFAIWRAREYTSNVYVTREQIRRVIMKLDPKPELFLWVDDDNPAPSPEQFDRLLSVLDSRPDVDGVFGWCWIYDADKRSFKVSAGIWSPDGAHWRPFDYFFPLETQPREVEASGFPCVLMRRSALEKAGDNAFLPILDDRLEHGLIGEDHAFLHRAEAAGAKFLVDPTCRVPHLKYCDCEPELPDVKKPAPRVAVMMRVRNEARWIARSIESVRELATWQSEQSETPQTHVYVLEDGSTDQTPELVEASGAVLVPSPYAGLGLDERRDKNFLTGLVRERCAPDWILCIDGDEELEPGGAEKLLRVLRTEPDVDVFSLGVLNLWDSADTIRVDGVYGKMGRQSLFRADTGAEFRSYYEGQPGHNHVGLHVSNAPFGLRTQALNVFLLHFGYLHRADRVRKYRWILTIDPTNEHEDYYRHTIQGDLPEVPADVVLKHGGPLKVQRLPARMVPQFAELPGPIAGLDPRTLPASEVTV